MVRDLTEAMHLAQEHKSIVIFDSFLKANNIINHRGYDSICCSISGGSDSDIMLDIIHKADFAKKVKYVWFDTGLEYQATKEHLDYLETVNNIFKDSYEYTEKYRQYCERRKK